jgi:antitoxin PrlF
MATSRNASSRITSTFTDRYQTTIPEAVRTHLGLNRRDQLLYTIDELGNVLLHRADASGHDPALRPFLTFLEHDLTQHPERLESLDAQRAGLLALTMGTEFDLDADLDPEDE